MDTQSKPYILSIPIEITSEIFLFLVHSIPVPPNCLSPNVYPRPLGQVCGRWRAIVHSCESLWARFAIENEADRHPILLRADDEPIPPPPGVEKVEDWLSKTGKSVLDITIRLGSQSPLNASFMSTLMRESYRWRSIDLQEWAPGLGLLPETSQSNSSRLLASLTEIHLKSASHLSYEAKAAADLLASEDLPNLRILSFNPVNDDGDLESLMAIASKCSSTLTSLFVEGKYVMTNKFVPVLATLPELVHLSVKGCPEFAHELHEALMIPEDPSSEPLVPKLETLDMNVVDAVYTCGWDCHPYDQDLFPKLLESRSKRCSLHTVRLWTQRDFPPLDSCEALVKLRDGGMDIVVHDDHWTGSNNDYWMNDYDSDSYYYSETEYESYSYSDSEMDFVF